MLLAAGFVPSLLSLSALKSRALRKGVWCKINPAARALIDAAIFYLKRGGRIKSPALLEALRKAAEEVLRLAAPIRVLAKAVGCVVTLHCHGTGRPPATVRTVRDELRWSKGKSIMSSPSALGSRLGGIPEIVDRYGAVASPSPEKIADAVAKVLETHYDRGEMMRYAFEKFSGGKERFLSWRR